MPKNPLDSDIFVRRTILEKRQRLNHAFLKSEADTAGDEAFMEASVAAAMIIAYADGDAGVSEYRRVIAFFRNYPAFQGFSVDDVAAEINLHTDAFSRDPEKAISRARNIVIEANLTSHQFDALVRMCTAVIEADLVCYPAEERALAEISALRSVGQV